MEVVFKTRKRVARELKYSAMFHEYNELLKDPNNDKMAVMGYLTEKHNISQSCFYQYMRKQKKAQV